MKPKFFMLILLFSLVLAKTELTAQGITGTWFGTIGVQGVELRILIHIKSIDNQNYTSVFDSPDQGAYNIPFTETYFENKKLSCISKTAGIVYEAVLKGNDTMNGYWKQSGVEIPLLLIKTNEVNKTEKPNRPQEPKPKFNYTQEEVFIYNPKTGVKLSGYLTKPKGNGPFPAVVLVSGSGPQNRDSEIFNHKPFLVLADYFSNKGIAVLRYDDRGTGLSTGDFDTSTTLDFANDAESAFEFLRIQKNIDSNRTGIVGHSEGGMIAPIVAAKNNNVRFIVSIAGPGIPIYKLILKQIKELELATGSDPDKIQNLLTFTESYFKFMISAINFHQAQVLTDSFINDYKIKNPAFNQEDVKGIQQTVKMSQTVWFYYFIKYNPADYIKLLTCSVLAVNGSLDIQVQADENLDAIEKYLNESNVPDYKIIKFGGLNHLMQNANTGAVSEYAKIEETFSVEAMNKISEWILKVE